MGLSEFSTQFLRFAITITLAHLLFPRDFGLIGLAAIFIGLIITFHELGLGAAIIQKKDIDEEHLSTAFWASINTGLLSCLFTLLLSQLVADFFDDERLQSILSTLSVVFIIGAFMTVNKSILTKNLDFKKIAIIEICAEVISGVVAIIQALTGFGVWSLVWRMLLGNLIMAILFWIVCPWRPSLTFNFKKFRELFSFSVNVTASRLINYGQSNVDNLFVGKLLGADALGYYSLAYRMITFPLRRISWIFTRVTFPAFSKIQDDNEKLKRGYLIIIRYISVITLPIIFGIFILAPEFVMVVLGDKWSPMILPLQILCMAGAIRSIVDNSRDILLAKGKANIKFKWDTITLCLLLLAITMGVRYGVVGVAVSVTVVIFIMYSTIQIITNRLINLELTKFLKAIYPSTMSSIFMVVIIFLLKEIAYLIYDVPQIFILLVSIPIGIICYMISLRFTWKTIVDDVKAVYRNVVDKTYTENL